MKEDILLNRLKDGFKGSLIMDADGKEHHQDGEATEEEKRAMLRHVIGKDQTH